LNKRGEPVSAAIMPDTPKRLGQIRLPAPDGNIEPSLRRAGIDSIDQPA
jgi:hypothetical protein